MAVKGLSELLEKYRSGEIKDASSFESELMKNGLYEGYIPKDKFDEKNNEAKKLKEQLEAEGKLVEELKAKGGLSDEYRAQIDRLKADMEEKDRSFTETIQKMRRDTAVEKALTAAEAREAKAVLPYIDMAKILVNEDGSVTGLNEQIEAVKKEHSFLFHDTSGSQGKNPPLFGNGGNPSGNGGTGDDILKAMRHAAGLE